MLIYKITIPEYYILDVKLQFQNPKLRFTSPTSPFHPRLRKQNQFSPCPSKKIKVLHKPPSFGFHYVLQPRPHSCYSPTPIALSTTSLHTSFTTRYPPLPPSHNSNLPSPSANKRALLPTHSISTGPHLLAPTHYPTRNEIFTE